MAVAIAPVETEDVPMGTGAGSRYSDLSDVSLYNKPETRGLWNISYTAEQSFFNRPLKFCVFDKQRTFYYYGIFRLVDTCFALKFTYVKVTMFQLAVSCCT